MIFALRRLGRDVLPLARVLFRDEAFESQERLLVLICYLLEHLEGATGIVLVAEREAAKQSLMARHGI